VRLRRTAGVSWHTVAPSAEQPRQRNSKCFAADVPQRDVDCRHGQGRYPAGAARRRCGAQFGDHLLRAQRVFALDEFAEFVKRRLQRADKLAAECGDADTLDAVFGEDLHSEEFAQHAGHWRGTD
jgi:hypothetical protein